MGVVYGLFLKWCKSQEGNVLIGDTSHWQTICPTWLDFWALYFKDLFSSSFQATPDILRHLSLQGAQDKIAAALLKELCIIDVHIF